jgi:hypothetical protein
MAKATLPNKPARSFTTTSNKSMFDLAVEEIQNKYLVNMTTYYNASKQCNTFRVGYANNNMAAYAELEVADEVATRFVSPNVLLEDLEKMTQGFLVSLGESITGKYPFIRLWAQRHIKSHVTENLMWNPRRQIPGWVFPKFKGQDEYPDEKFVKPLKGVTIASDGLGPSIPTSTPKVTSVLGIPIEEDSDKHDNNSKIEYIDETMDRKTVVAQTKQKRVVKRGKAPINPNKVKKPPCSKHEVEMKFNPVRQLWECSIPGCTMVSRPKRAEDDRSVQIGKGSVTARLIGSDEEVVVLLVSDDNIALDITKFVNLKKIVSDLGIKSLVSTAVEDGKDTFRLNIDAELNIALPLTVMGAHDLDVSL